MDDVSFMHLSMGINKRLRETLHKINKQTSKEIAAAAADLSGTEKEQVATFKQHLKRASRLPTDLRRDPLLALIKAVRIRIPNAGKCSCHNALREVILKIKPSALQSELLAEWTKTFVYLPEGSPIGALCQTSLDQLRQLDSTLQFTPLLALLSAINNFPDSSFAPGARAAIFKDAHEIAQKFCDGEPMTVLRKAFDAIGERDRARSLQSNLLLG